MGKPEKIGDVVRRAVEDARTAWEAQQRDPDKVRRELEWEEESERSHRNAELRGSGIFRVLRDADMHRVVTKSYEPTEFVVRVQHWLRSPEPFIVLLGPTGRGKTVAGAVALAERGGMYLRARACARIFAANFGEEYRLSERALNANLLCVDDLGTERNAHEMHFALAEIIDARQGGAKTILTANLTRAEFEGRYLDEREISRFDGAALFWGDTGPDMRRNTAA